MRREDSAARLSLGPGDRRARVGWEGFPRLTCWEEGLKGPETCLRADEVPEANSPGDSAPARAGFSAGLGTRLHGRVNPSHHLFAVCL